MLPLILGGIAALGLMKRNPRRRRSCCNPRRRTFASLVRDGDEAVIATVNRALATSSSLDDAAREIHQLVSDHSVAEILAYLRRTHGTIIRRNPTTVRGTKRLASRLFNWHGGQGSGVYEVASNWHSGRPARIEAINDAWRELAQSLKRVTEMHGKGYTKRDLADITGLTRRLGLIAASYEGLGRNPKRRRRGGKVSVDAAAARLAQWRWHRNPVKMSPGLYEKFNAALSGVAASEGATPRKRWDALWAHGGSQLTRLAYAEGLNDSHIDTVLRQVIGASQRNPKDEKTLSQLAHEDPDACMDLCDRAALAICADAVRLGKYDSPYLKAITVKDALKDAKRNRRNPTWDIQAGDRVTIRTPQGQKRTGRAVMRGAGGWVLNLGGRYGTPGIAAPDNIVSVRRGKRRGPTILG